jgi:hypothetical protein
VRASRIGATVNQSVEKPVELLSPEPTTMDYER